jgi:hypothetical protein
MINPSRRKDATPQQVNADVRTGASTSRMVDGLRHLNRRIARRTRRLRRHLFLDLAAKEDPIIIAGDGRSGTTWVSDIVNYSGEFRYMFEPFHPHYVEEAKGLKLFQYLRPTDDEPHCRSIVESVLSGRLRHNRVDQFNHRLLYTKRIIKDIFPHLFLKWLKVQHPNARIVLLLRHPIAVALSKQKLIDKFWMTDPRDFLSQPELCEDFLLPYRHEINAAKTFLEKQVLIWCIVHSVPLAQFRPGEIHLAFYEHFCTDPENEIRRLFSFIGVPLPEDGLQGRISEVVNGPSRTSRKDSAIHTGESLIGAWRDRISDEEMSRLLAILEAFRLNAIYGADPMPNPAGAHALLGATDSVKGVLRHATADNQR